MDSKSRALNKSSNSFSAARNGEAC